MDRGANRSIGVFAGITLVLIALILAGISLAKNLELGYMQPRQTQTTSNDTKNQNNGSQNGGQTKQNNPTQTGGTSTNVPVTTPSPAPTTTPTPTQNQPTTPVATTSPAAPAKTVPSTGPSFSFLVTGLVVSVCVYLIMFIRQTRVVARRRILS
ncbi:MAG TPA: hypothetical protein VNG90_03835 [Candidatus Acidoferrum sp.]|nr:hypothetical protein [Candidatus Acidoferrum sp.]